MPFARAVEALLIPSAIVLTIIDLWMIVDAFETWRASSRPVPPPPRDHSYPAATAVIAAYLPNERAIIVPTVEYFLDELEYPGALCVMLAYNTPEALPVLAELEAIVRREPRFRLLHVPDSTRKGTNVNYALQHVETPYVGVFDADSRPERSCFTKAAEHLGRGWDLVQGSAHVGVARNLWERLNAVEMVLKFQVSYAARHTGFGMTYFCGKNGYWRTSAVRRAYSSEVAQTEDVDMSLRALLGGARLMFDPLLMLHEDAPPTFRAWWVQRVRWAEGWAQLVKWHLAPVFRSATVGPRCRAAWTYHLLGRRVVLPIAFVAFTLALATALLSGDGLSRYGAVAAGGRFGLQILGTLAMGVTVLASAERRRTAPSFTLPALLAYASVVPVYDYLRCVTLVRGCAAFFHDPQRYVCTPRVAPELRGIR
jgi:cellulose synthase/poly-beta-1,6-N-acetylglucosamine synthase-like glycosyltransferase